MEHRDRNLRRRIIVARSRGNVEQMNAPQRVSICLVFVALVVGTGSDPVRKTPVVMLGGYRVLAVDFHVHSFPLSWALLEPFDTVLEARRQGLDVIALTPHNNVWVAKVGRWFARSLNGPTVLVGEEIVSPRYHLLAVGIEARVDWRQSAAGAMEEIHRQRGVAIAAHPLKAYWAAYDEAAMRALDATEVFHPYVYINPQAYAELRQFYGRSGVTAIGDSDYHGLGPMGSCRTFVFAKSDSQDDILEAIRTGHTVVTDKDGRMFGGPSVLQIALLNPQFEKLQSPTPRPGVVIKASSICGLLGLLGILVFGYARPQHSSAPKTSIESRP